MKRNFIKMKNCSAKDNVKRGKQSHNQHKIFCKGTSDRRLLSKMYKEISNSIDMKQLLILKMGHRFQYTFKEAVQMQISILKILHIICDQGNIN